MQTISEDDRAIAIIDTYRSILMALAVVHGGNPESAVRKHEEWCEMMDDAKRDNSAMRGLNPIAEEWRNALPPPSQKMSPVQWYGGKGKLLRFILPIIEAAGGKVYVEPYFGGGRFSSARRLIRWRSSMT